MCLDLYYASQCSRADGVSQCLKAEKEDFANLSAALESL
jgi:hypothetical protein